MRDRLAISIDWMPTIAQYCDVPLPKGRIDGESIVPIIDSAESASPHNVLHWETQGGKQWAVRADHWKLVYGGPATQDQGRRLPAAETFLSDMRQDVTETQNLAEQHPDVVERLTRLHAQWVKDVKEQ